jgi:ABC-2 type transport system permease protein
MRFLRSSYVIARRDFAATVLSKAFIFFLLGPLFPLLLGGVFGGIGARVASQTERPVVAVVMDPAEGARLGAARARVADAIGDEAVVRLVYHLPDADGAAQQKRLLSSRSPSIRAVLSGNLESPHVAGAIKPDDPTARQLDLIIRDARLPAPAVAPLDIAEEKTAAGGIAKDRMLTGQIGQMLLFFLTLMLSTMVLSQLIEEKSNKIIEVIAAAMPIDALFVGKLFAMLSASVLGLVVWIGSGALLIQLIKYGGVATLPTPAVGWPAFLFFGVVYFAMNYLLFGAAFLTIGAQASTSREVQVMSMPITFAQVLIFGLASIAIGSPDSPEGLAAAIFPLSSPMTMLARAAEQPELWPHVAAILWQGLWVGLILRLGAQLFRKTVLKSGPRTPWWKLNRA